MPVLSAGWVGVGGEEPERKSFGRVVGDLEPFDPAHVAGGAGRDRHVLRGELLGVGAEVHAVPLGVKKDAVLGLGINLNLGMVRSHMALAAGLGKPGQFYRGTVARMTLGAAA